MQDERVQAALDELGSTGAVAKLMDRDPGLWSTEPEVADSVGRRLGWLDVAGGRDGWGGELDDLVAAVRADGLDRVVLAGMGGSSLAPHVFATVMGRADHGLSLQVLDSTHPQAVRALLDDADLERTLVVVSSKSGTTEETRDFGAHAARLLPGPRQLVAITDPGSELAEAATAQGWRAVLHNPPDIGGRYSALSLFGMLPAALLGLDVRALWAAGQTMLERCAGPPPDNPGAQLAAFAAGHARAGRDKLTLLAPPALAPLGDWVEQLVAESTGKHGTGIVPVVGEPVGSPDVYGDDRAFVVLGLAGQQPAGVQALVDAGHPVLSIDVPGVAALSGEFVRWEVATALAGVLLGINPFDEPNVAESKANTARVLDEVADGTALPQPGHGDVAALLGAVDAGDYIALQAYLAPTPATSRALQRLRVQLRDRLRAATTLGYGPRFLHSTGQLHKGGPGTVVALQLVDPVTGGPDIPGRPFDFATLLRAQAVGDLQSLLAHDRRVAQVAATGDTVDAVTAEIASIVA